MSLRDQIDRSIAEAVQTTIRRLQRRPVQGYGPGVRMEFGKASANGVAAMSGSTPGKATDVTRWEWADDNIQATTTTDVVVYNFSQTAVAASALIAWVEMGGKNVVILEDCG